MLTDQYWIFISKYESDIEVPSEEEIRTSYLLLSLLISTYLLVSTRISIYPHYMQRRSNTFVLFSKTKHSSINFIKL